MRGWLNGTPPNCSGCLRSLIQAFSRSRLSSAPSFGICIPPPTNSSTTGPAALAFGFSPTDRAGDVFCSIAIYGNKDVQFGFTKGDVLSDPQGLLEGAGKHWRYIRVSDMAKFPRKYAERLLAESHTNSIAAAKGLSNAPSGQTIVKSISEKKRRPKRS